MLSIKCQIIPWFEVGTYDKTKQVISFSLKKKIISKCDSSFVDNDENHATHASVSSVLFIDRTISTKNRVVFQFLGRFALKNIMHWIFVVRIFSYYLTDTFETINSVWWQWQTFVFIFQSKNIGFVMRFDLEAKVSERLCRIMHYKNSFKCIKIGGFSEWKN